MGMQEINVGMRGVRVEMRKIMAMQESRWNFRYSSRNDIA